MPALKIEPGADEDHSDVEDAEAPEDTVVAPHVLEYKSALRMKVIVKGVELTL